MPSILPKPLGPFCHRHSRHQIPETEPAKNKLQKSGKFWPPIYVQFRTTFSPQIHHDETIKKPRSAARNLQNPQQKRPFNTK
jgi:hypothetical protein